MTQRELVGHGQTVGPPPITAIRDFAIEVDIRTAFYLAKVRILVSDPQRLNQRRGGDRKIPGQLITSIHRQQWGLELGAGEGRLARDHGPELEQEAKEWDRQMQSRYEHSRPWRRIRLRCSPSPGQ